MGEFFKKTNIAVLAVIVVAAVFVAAVFLGIRHGKAVAGAKQVESMVAELKKGLDYFLRDQNRYPTAQEFLDRNIQLTYFSQAPDNLTDNSVCKENFTYKRVSLTVYELDFCLAANLGQYRAGWNKLVRQ